MATNTRFGARYNRRLRGYSIGMGAMMESVIFVPNLVRNLESLRFAQTNSTRRKVEFYIISN